MTAHRRTLNEPSGSAGILENSDPLQDFNEDLEGAVGFQSNSFDDQFISNSGELPINVRPNLSNVMNLDENSFQDTENNNVDENSNDHQYNQYANYHHQYQDQSFLLDNEAYNQRAAREQAARERVYQRLHNSVDQPDRVNVNVSVREQNILRPLYSGSTHRRNHSEDLSLSARVQTLPSLPSRHSNFENNQPNLAWLPALQSRRCQPSREEINNEAEALLYNFTIEEFRSQNIDPSPLPVQPYLSNPTWARAGQDLRMLADAFSKSNEREIVRRKAYDINLNSITMNNFFHLCNELFEGDGGITQERIVVLFTFISDVAIQHVRLKAEQFIKRLMIWSLRFIYERICEWVQRAGGWGAVLNSGASFLFKSTMTVLASLGIVALGVYILKTIKEL